MTATLDRDRIIDAMLADFEQARQLNNLRDALRHLLDAGLPTVADRPSLDELPPRTRLLTADGLVIQLVKSCTCHRLIVTLDGSAPELSRASWPMTVLALP